MYFAAKLLEATGLGLLGYAFIKTFPEKLNYKVLGVSVILFACGWIIEKYILKR
ncbi:MAG: hypothetical protein KA403_07765 [Candidatus Omnitrophica bacterium]|nr:hypothetical protein [Candidatus Omnitrophota bacterium]